jgi:hypothetical protein
MAEASRPRGCGLASCHSLDEEVLNWKEIYSVQNKLFFYFQQKQPVCSDYSPDLKILILAEVYGLNCVIKNSETEKVEMYNYSSTNMNKLLSLVCL